jgi:hypothetical protein
MVELLVRITAGDLGRDVVPDRKRAANIARALAVASSVVAAIRH